MAAQGRRRIKVGLKVKGKKRPRQWHRGIGQDRAWREAIEPLDAELIESIENGGTAHPRPEMPW